MKMYRILNDLPEDNGTCELCKTQMEIRNYYKSASYYSIFFVCPSCGHNQLLLLESINDDVDYD